MKKIVLLMMSLLFVSFEVFAQSGGVEIQWCHKVEGVRLRGCSPQSHPFECGPPKPCPPCTYFTECGSYIMAASGGGGVCIKWGEPRCYDTPDGRQCDPAQCIEYTEPGCEERTVSCAIGPGQEFPQGGTYDCSVIECTGCPPPPPGLKLCPSPLPCQPNTRCQN